MSPHPVNRATLAPTFKRYATCNKVSVTVTAHHFNTQVALVIQRSPILFINLTAAHFGQFPSFPSIHSKYLTIYFITLKFSLTRAGIMYQLICQLSASATLSML